MGVRAQNVDLEAGTRSLPTTSKTGTLVGGRHGLLGDSNARLRFLEMEIVLRDRRQHVMRHLRHVAARPVTRGSWPRQAVERAAEIHRLGADENPHVRRNHRGVSVTVDATDRSFHFHKLNLRGLIRSRAAHCADGRMPTLLTGREPLVICAPDPSGDHALADLVYAAEVPAGSCVDHGRSCYFRDAGTAARGAGVRYFRVRYAQRGRGNRVWLESSGDLSAEQHARMLLLVRIDTPPRAVLEDTSRPLPKGDWFSPS